MNDIYLTVLIPFYNEEGSLEKLWLELQPVLEKLKKNYEVILINDGSNDGSHAIAQKLVKNNNFIKLIHNGHNQGKAAVLQQGFNAAVGEFVVTMDADLQDDPKEITRLLKAIGDKNCDLVSGWKKSRHDPWHKVIPSFFFNGMIRKFSGVGLHDINCGLKIYRKAVIKSVSIYGELYRFIPVLAVNKGFKVDEIVVNHRERQFGQSKYGISRFIRGFLDLLTVIFVTKFLKRPLHLFGPIGLTLFGVGVIILGYLSYLHYAEGQSIGERPLLIFGVMFVIAGLQIFFTGLIAELITYYAQTNLNKQKREAQN